jgi:SPW repeat-containing protein
MTTQTSEPATRRERPTLPAHQGEGGGPGGPVANGLVFLAGLYLVLSPWVISSTGQFGIAASNIITGLAVALLAVGCSRPTNSVGAIAWVIPVLGAWAIASPWAIYRGSGLVPMAFPTPLTTATWVSNVIAGAVVMVAGAGFTLLFRAGRRRA